MAIDPASVVVTDQQVREWSAKLSASVFADAWEAALVAAIGQLEAVHKSGTAVPYEVFGRIEALRKTDEATLMQRLRKHETALGLD